MATTKKAATKKVAKKAAAARPAAARALDPGLVREAVRGKRFLAADRAALDLGEIVTWDRYLLRESRLLVPMDVQALYVPPDDTEPMLRLPMLVANVGASPVSDPEAGLPDPFDAGQPRPAGVHLHWAMPDALLRGTLTDRNDAGANRLGLPALPDRFVVLRIVLPNGAADPVLTGWVIEADRAVAVPLAVWAEGNAAAASATAAGAPIPRKDLTGTVGGGLAWASVYDAVLNRFAFHDPLSDIAVVAPQGVDGDSAAYLVAGWWSEAALDPLDAARSDASLHELLERLRWRLMVEWGDEGAARAQREQQDELRRSLGLQSGTRWSAARPVKVAARAAAGAAPFVPVDKTLVVADTVKTASVFATDAGRRFAAPPWHLRASLLHGTVYGVPVAGKVSVDRRPAAAEVSAALGHHDDDLLAAFAAAAGTNADERRSTERLIAAFTAQKVSRLGSADGLVELEEAEHAGAFVSLPSGSAGNDRYLQRVQTGGGGGLGIGRKRAADVVGLAMQSAAVGGVAKTPSPTPLARGPAAAGSAAITADLVFATKSKPTLIQADTAVINDLARSRVGEVLAPTEVRVVDRPAPRWTFPSEPMVALRGAARSLRHGHDGRGSADGKLTCRWPTHTITEISGLIAADRFVRSLGNGSVPGEALLLAREALLHDPYHDEWIAAAVAPPGAGRTSVLTRLKAESVLRFGADGIYDGATVALGPKPPRARRGASRAAAQPLEPGVREQQTLLAD